MPEIETYDTGSKLNGIKDVTGTTSGTKTFLDSYSRLIGLDDQNDLHEVKVSHDGFLSTIDNSNGLSIARGNVSGLSFIHKFGNAPDFDSGDNIVSIWDGADD